MFSKRFVIALLLVPLALVGCSMPVILESTGEYQKVHVEAYRYDSGAVSLPVSKYSRGFTYYLGPDFADLDDPTFWPRAHEKVEKLFEVRPSTDFPEDRFFEVPPIDWLRENGEAYVYHQYIVEYTLPPGGVIMSETIPSVCDDLEGSEGFPIFNVVVEGQVMCVSPEASDAGQNGGKYTTYLSLFYHPGEDWLLFYHPENSQYYSIDIPEEILELEPATLDELGGERLEFVLQAEVMEKH